MTSERRQTNHRRTCWSPLTIEINGLSCSRIVSWNNSATAVNALHSSSCACCLGLRQWLEVGLSSESWSPVLSWRRLHQEMILRSTKRWSWQTDKTRVPSVSRRRLFQSTRPGETRNSSVGQSAPYYLDVSYINTKRTQSSVNSSATGQAALSIPRVVLDTEFKVSKRSTPDSMQLSPL